MAEPARIIGYWRQPPPTTKLGLPDPATLVDHAWEADRRERLAAYLDAGHATCRFADCRHPDRDQLGCRDLSDGTWVWPDGLAHYLRAHHVRLPDELVASAAARDFAPPGPEVAEAPLRVDPRFWLRWTAEHTPPPPAEPDACSFGDARAICDQLATARWRAVLSVELSRWRIERTAMGVTLVDYSGPISPYVLREYLFDTRISDDAAVLSPDRAIAIGAELAPTGTMIRPFAGKTSDDGRVWWAILASGARPTRRFEELDLSKVTMPEPGWVSFLPGNWRVEVCPGMDELAWRFFIERWLRRNAAEAAAEADG